MIRNSFIFLPKIKQKKESNIWSQGIKDWDSFISHNIVKGISKKAKAFYDRELANAKKALYSDDSSYFLDKLPSTETWRLYNYFKDEAIFIDIETSSSISMDSYITVIGLFDSINTKTMVKDINLDIKELRKELSKYKIMLSFNGSTFDLPYLNKKYPGLLPKIPHIDLRHCCARIGLCGGLKDIERQLQIKRSNEIVERLYGGDPIKLWRMFKGSGDDYYLKLLVEYNEEDVINLKKISDYTISKMKESYKTLF